MSDATDHVEAVLLEARVIFGQTPALPAVLARALAADVDRLEAYIDMLDGRIAKLEQRATESGGPA